MKYAWPIITLVGVPLLMSVTKSVRINGRERHEIQMRVKYYSEFRIKGAAFVHKLQTRVLDELDQSKDELCGREMESIISDAWHGKHVGQLHETKKEEKMINRFYHRIMRNTSTANSRVQLMFAGLHSPALENIESDLDI